MDVKALIRKRGSVKGRLTSFANYVESVKNRVLSKVESIELEERSKRIELLLSEYSAIHEKILEVAKDDEIADHENQRESFDNELFKISAIARSLILASQHNQSVLNQSVANSSANSDYFLGTPSSNSTIKLPTLKLPEFDGSFDKWLGYYDTFKSVIHLNPSISKIQKFHYLSSSLVKDAEQVIKGLEISENNYDIAWELLQRRYQNKGLMIHNHIKSIVEYPSLQKTNADLLRTITNTIQTHIRALQALQQPVDSWGSLLIYLVVDKLDSGTKKEWEKLVVNLDELPTVDDLFEFLECQCQFLEKIAKTSMSSDSSRHNLNKGVSRKSVLASTVVQPCSMCQKEHAIFACERFHKLSINNRIAEIKRQNRCLNCLKAGHMANSCQSKGCRKCSKMHNTLLHLEKTTDESKNEKVTDESKNVSLVSSNQDTFNLLPTAVIDVIDNEGNTHECTALLDSGSQSNFLTSHLSKRLNLPMSKVNLNILGISLHDSNISESVQAIIKSKHSDLETSLQFLVIPQITSRLPSEYIDIHKLKLPQGIRLADPAFYKPKDIDMLIGVDLFWDILTYERSCSPYLHNTKLGVIVSGSIPIRHPFQRNRHCNTSILSEQLRKFWEIEEIPRQEHLSAEQKACEKSFITSTKRNENGRFVVTIPFKESLDTLGDSEEQAKRRFQAMEKKLQRNETLKEKYTHFMDEYQNLQHMSLVDGNQSHQHAYYLPHHGVLKETSLTTKLRVVFDGSAATTSGVSLNDIQMVGPVIQQDLFSILLRFRQHPYAVGADIAMMYRQIQINPNQRSIQRIFWRSEPNEPLRTYELNTVTYGLASSSYLAIRCLFQIADENEHEFPTVAKVIRNNMYVDDLLYGASTIEEAINIRKQISAMFNSAGFQLRKWISNEPSILDELLDSEQKSECQVILLGENEVTKTLGLSWSCATDEFIYVFPSNDSTKCHTKRTIASAIARIYDPLGILGPFVLKAKLILQQLWLCKISWDDSLPSEIKEDWEKFLASVLALEKVNVPRQTICTSPEIVEIIAFSDASESAYGACVYIRSINADGKVFVNLLTAKSKVSPLKCLKNPKRTPKEPITIPKLELCAALLSAKLVERVKRSFDIKIDNILYWSDSTIVLGWLRKEPYALKTFVSNRVFEIQSLTSIDQWYHVSSEENPADLLSRGAFPQSLGDFWWKGPTWLSLPKYNLPPPMVEENLPELKSLNKVTSICSSIKRIIDFENYSNLDKLERILAYCLRFIQNTRKSKASRQYQSITFSEIQNSHVQLVKFSQYESFAEEIKRITEQKLIKKGSKLFKLNPFLHTDGTLRMRGRLANSNYSFSKCNPLILPSNHHLTKLIFRREHQRLLHVGPQTLLSHIRDMYWPIRGRDLAKRTVSECTICFKVRPKSLNPLMGNLPRDRVTPAPPFNITGVDYAGPFIIKDRKGRGCKTSKCYIAVFICFVTRAIHLELVTDLTTDCFIMSLRRFASRWGMPCTIYSDNGTTFVGAKNELKELGKYLQMNESVLTEQLAKERFNWQFIPTYSPHFGGIWEAGVKSTKHHLRRVVKNVILTFEEMYSLLCQISAILNSRPLTPLSNSPMDLNPLTPAHFLIGRPMTAVPDPDVCHIAPSYASRYQLIQQLQQHFWIRWSKEFISELQTRSKWNESHASLKEDMLTLIKDDNLPSMKWALGRIVKLHPGVDHVVRVVTLRTSKGLIRRPVHKLCPLPIEDSTDKSIEDEQSNTNSNL